MTIVEQILKLAYNITMPAPMPQMWWYNFYPIGPGDRGTRFYFACSETPDADFMGLLYHYEEGTETSSIRGRAQSLESL